MQVETLTHIPTSSQTLLAALGTAFKSPKKVIPELPVLVMDNLRPDQQRLDAFNRMFGYSGTYVPSTYWHTRLFGVRIALAARREFPFPLPGMVHFTDSIRQHETISPTDALRMECRLGRFLTHEKGTAFETLTKLYRNDTLVWEENTVNLYIGKIQLGEAEYVGHEFAELQDPQVRELHIPGNMGRKYASISGDYNPIHISTLGAKMFGFKRKLMHGWYGLNQILALHPEKVQAPHEVYAAFKRPLLLPGHVLLKQETDEKQVRFEIANAKEGYPNLKGFLNGL